ncbi:phosphoenolpyruvate carboxykinase (ATP) [Staphylococcus epidermidis]
MSIDTYTETLKINQLIEKATSHFQLSSTQLYKKILKNHEGELTELGAINVKTGKYTGRSPKDKFIVTEPSYKDNINWGDINQPMDEETFLKLYNKVLDYLNQKDELYIFSGYAGSDKESRLKLKVINELAWHNLFARNMFIRPESIDEAQNIKPNFTIVSAPNFKANPELDGTNSETFVIISFKHKVILIGGTEYAGEMKKGIFSVMNYLLPMQDIMSMHCSANVGEKGDVALFFGLSGTGKTTLSADPKRKLIGDDEHGWNKNGVFNIEGGCYAKAIHLSKQKEPQIYNAIKYGTILENTVTNDDGTVDFDDNTYTENTRAAYPIDYIENIVTPSKAAHPNTIIFLTADAFGVIPPISKLTKDQAMYHFLSGFTSKLAGTERGVTEPQPSFSTCFGAPFLPLNPTKYADLLGNLIDIHDVDVYLVNTGWTGGKYGIGRRISLHYTREMVDQAISGKLKNTKYIKDDTFGLNIPVQIDNVPTTILNPINAWNNKDNYKAQAYDLIQRFNNNFKKFGKEVEHIANKGGWDIIPNKIASK